MPVYPFFVDRLVRSIDDLVQVVLATSELNVSEALVLGTKLQLYVDGKTAKVPVSFGVKTCINLSITASDLERIG